MFRTDLRLDFHLVQSFSFPTSYWVNWLKNVGRSYSGPRETVRLGECFKIVPMCLLLEIIIPKRWYLQRAMREGVHIHSNSASNRITYVLWSIMLPRYFYFTFHLDAASMFSQWNQNRTLANQKGPLWTKTDILSVTSYGFCSTWSCTNNLYGSMVTSRLFKYFG